MDDTPDCLRDISSDSCAHSERNKVSVSVLAGLHSLHDCGSLRGVAPDGQQPAFLLEHGQLRPLPDGAGFSSGVLYVRLPAMDPAHLGRDEEQ